MMPVSILLQQQLLFDSSPLFLVLFLAIALGAAYLLYSQKYTWSRSINLVLAVIRGIMIFVLLVLLLGPFIRQVRHLFEKPLFVILQDNSISVKSVVDSVRRATLNQKLVSIQEHLENQDYETYRLSLSGSTATPLVYDQQTSDLNSALQKIASRFEGKKLAGVLLVSDGIYNSGISPLYSSFNFPVYTIGVGDTVVRPDIVVRNLNFNRIAYQGNRFPLQAELSTVGFSGNPVTVTVSQQGKVVERQTKIPGNNSFLVFDFQLLADKAGLQRIEVSAAPLQGEFNIDNNAATAFVEVVEGKKKILLLAPAPSPDIKALKSVVDRNPNYSFLTEIPGVIDLKAESLAPENLDLVILYQSPDTGGETQSLFNRYMNSKLPLLIVTGKQSDVRQLTRVQIPLNIEQVQNQFDDVIPSLNPAFGYFNLAPEDAAIFSSYPPVAVPFGKTHLNLSASSILFQRVGSVNTDKPLVAVDSWNDRRLGFMLGEGFWQWRLNEYLHNENTDAFDELFGKLLQYLSTADDKSKFRCYPIRREFPDSEPVIFETQAYNDVYEPIYGNDVKIEVRDEQGKKKEFEYVTSPSASRYEAGSMPEGVYIYTAATDINGKQQSVKGQFLVVARQIELQNVTADFGLLRKLSAQTGGRFVRTDQLDELTRTFEQKKAVSTIHSETHFDSLINLKWVFWVLVAGLLAEWFLRKYFGAY